MTKKRILSLLLCVVLVLGLLPTAAGAITGDGSATAPTYTVTFDGQGRGPLIESQTIEEGGKVKKPSNLAAYGQTFGGWFTDSRCTKAWDFDNDVVTKDMTLYAKWTQIVQVTVDMNGIALEDKTFDDEALTYSGAAAGTIVGDSAPYTGGFRYEWLDANNNVLTGAPVNAGTYTLRATVSAEYHVGSDTKTVTIDKLAVTIGPDALPQKVGQAFQTFHLSCSSLEHGGDLMDGLTPEFTVTGPDGQTVDTTQPIAQEGNYTVTWSNMDASAFANEKNFEVTLVETATFVVTAEKRMDFVPPIHDPVEQPLPFDDVSDGDWFYEEVRYVHEAGLMGGTGYRTFAPQSPLTRAMVWTILARIDGVNTNGSPWYAAGQAWAMKNGISDGTDPMAPITREQLAATLYRSALYWNRQTYARADLSGFPDAAKVSGYATEAMQWAVGSGIIGGSNGKLNPQGNATRAEAAAMLMRFQEKT